MLNKNEFIRAYRMGYVRGAEWGASDKYDPQHLEKLDLKIVDEHAEAAFRLRLIQISND